MHGRSRKSIPYTGGVDGNNEDSLVEPGVNSTYYPLQNALLDYGKNGTVSAKQRKGLV